MELAVGHSGGERMAYTQTTDRRLSLRIVVIIFSLLHARAGELEIHRTDAPIEGLRGHNTTIPCLFYGYGSDLDLSTVSARWTLRTEEGEKPVYWFHGGHLTPNRSGSQISEDGLRSGDASLYISNLQFSDDGEYTCTLFVTPYKAVSKVTLQVSAEPLCTVSDSIIKMTPDTERSVTCYVNGFYPKPLTIQWLKISKVSSTKTELDSLTCTSVPVQNQDGTYNVTSMLSVKTTSLEEDGDVYSCVIHHRSLKDDLTNNITLSVQPVPDNKISVILGSIIGALVLLLIWIGAILYIKYSKKVPPEVLDIIGPGLIHMKRSNLVCPIVNFSPQNIDISLYLKKDNVKVKVDSWNSKRKEIDQDQNVPLLEPSPLVLKPCMTPTKNGVFSCICSIPISPDLQEHNGATLIVEVHHKALKEPMCKDIILKVKAPPVLDPIKPNQESYNVGDHLELTCKIHSFYPQYINVVWYKVEEILLSKNILAQEDGKKSFYVTSCVRHMVKEDDFGKVFRCKVEHPVKGDENETTWTLQM